MARVSGQNIIQCFNVIRHRVSPRPLVVPLGVPLLVILHLVHSPDGALNVFDPLEALVEREIVTNCVLKIRDPD